MMSLRTPLSKAVGLGAAGEGAAHWWMQRMTAVALVPLVIWFAFSVALIGEMSYEAITAWIGSPIAAVLLIVLIVSGFYHLQLGMKVIIEDYTHVEWMKLSGIIMVNFVCIVLMVAGILSVLKIALGAS
jgi:succinate dehydrogenase / fumarate reductase membrane anchor subunit